jgi:hypothetical protein
MLVQRNELMNADDEVKELERLLNEAVIRKRRILKQKSLQGWLDWVWELLGY